MINRFSRNIRLSRQRGFTLILVLFLVALLAIMVLGLLVRTTKETEVEGLVNHKGQARMNALFALDEAVSRLQVAAGPDTRVTASASILDSDPETGEIEQVEHPRWIGVWKTTLDDQDKHPLIERPYRISKTPEPLELGIESHLTDSRTEIKSRDDGVERRAWDRELDVIDWLVSIPEVEDLDEDGFTLNPREAIDGDTITMITEREEEGPVLAPRVKLGERGAYAFWVGDQSLKTKVTVHNPYENDAIDPEDPKGRGMRPLITALELPLETLEGLEALEGKPQEERKNVHHFRDLSLLAEPDEHEVVNSVLPQHFHRLTTQSFGVLADVTTGGLKRNLTAYLESPTGFIPPKSSGLDSEDSDGNETREFPGLRDSSPIIDAPRFRYYSPKFGILRDFGNTLIPQTGSDAIIEVRPPEIRDTAINFTQPQQPAPVTGPRIRPGIHPVLSECSIYMVPAYDPEDQMVKMLFFPRVQLYNPYNVKMKGETYVVQISARWHKKFYFEARALRDGEEVSHTLNFQTHGGYRGGLPFHGAHDFTFQLDPVDIEPGETLLFCPDPKQGNEPIAESRSARLYRSHEGQINKMKLSARVDPAELTCFWYPIGGDLFRETDDLTTFRIFIPSWWYPANDYWGPHRVAKLFLSKDGDVPNEDWVNLRNSPAMPLLQVVEAFAHNRGNRGMWPRWNRTYQFNEVEAVLDGGIPTDLHKYWWVGYRMLRHPETHETIHALYGKDYEFPVLTQYDIRAPYATYQPVPGGARYIYGPNGASNYHDIYAVPWTGASGTEGLANEGRTAPLYESERGVFTSSPFFWPAMSRGDLRAPLFELGRQNVPQISLGQFRHASLFAFNHFPTNVLGESFASIYAPRGFSAPRYQSYKDTWGTVQTRRYSQFAEMRTVDEFEFPPPMEEKQGTHSGKDYFLTQDVCYSGYDASYEVNHALWDRFFLTGIDTKTEEDTNGKWSAGEPLPNPRLVINPFGGDEGQLDRLNDYHLAAGELMIDGPLNVNCTDPKVWSLALKTLRNQGIPTVQGLDFPGKDLSPFPRHLIPNAKHGDPESSDDPENWKAFQGLTDEQIDGLAEKIVEQVKIRAPFVSLADFVNRRLVSGDSYAPESGEETPVTRTGLSGPIQAALDDEELQINGYLADVENAPIPPDYTGYRTHNPPHRFAGAPGAITQGDILTRIGSTLVPRGDTFVVRAYGESLSRNGTTLANAWCEAIVQRTNRYLESTDIFTDPAKDPPERAGANLVSRINQKFGRRFEIVGFRWLNEDEL